MHPAAVILIMLNFVYLQTSFRTIMPYQAQVRWIYTSTDKHIEVLMNNVLHLKPKVRKMSMFVIITIKDDTDFFRGVIRTKV